MRILHVITDLGQGGTERMLNRLSTTLINHEYLVVTLGKKKEMDNSLKEKNIKVINLNLEFNFLIFSKFMFLYKLIKKFNPNVVHTWLAPADLVGGIISYLVGKKNIIWSIRHSNLDRFLPLRGKLLIKILSILSYKIPQKIISNSDAGRKYFIQKGYCQNKIIVIPNGVDLNYYRENLITRVKVKKELKIEKNHIMVGSVGRYVELKNYNLFIKIAKNLSKKNDNFRFILIGNQMSKQNKILVNLLKNENLLKKFYLLGEKKNINDYYNIMDFYIHTSKTEGFSNAIAESMASSVITFATDAGDTKKIIYNNYFLLSESSLKSTCNKINSISNLHYKNSNSIRKKMRKKIELNFDINKIKKLYEKVYFSTKSIFLIKEYNKKNNNEYNKKININLDVFKSYVKEPGARRRILYYLKNRNFKYKMVNNSKDSDLVYLAQNSDLSNIKFRREKFYIFDFVDSYLDIPFWEFKSVFRGLGKFFIGQHKKLKLNYTNTLIECCKKSDMVICSSEEQRKIILKYNSNVFPILDFNDDYSRETKKNYTLGKKVKIAWEGLPENLVQLKQVKLALEKLSKEFDIELIVVTDGYFYKYFKSILKVDTKKYLGEILGKNIKFTHIEWKIDSYYKDLIKTDFIIIPINLSDKLVAGKPENKLLHLWKLRMPVITTETLAYKRTMIKTGLNDCAKNDINFYKLCKNFIENRELRVLNAKKGYKYSTNFHNNKKILKQWDSALKIL